MNVERWMKKLDEVLDKHGIVENRDAIKDDIYHEIIQEAYDLGYEDGNDPKSFWRD